MARYAKSFFASIDVNVDEQMGAKYLLALYRIHEGQRLWYQVPQCVTTSAAVLWSVYTWQVLYIIYTCTYLCPSARLRSSRRLRHWFLVYRYININSLLDCWRDPSFVSRARPCSLLCYSPELCGSGCDASRGGIDTCSQRAFFRVFVSDTLVPDTNQPCRCMWQCFCMCMMCPVKQYKWGI